MRSLNIFPIATSIILIIIGFILVVISYNLNHEDSQSSTKAEATIAIFYVLNGVGCGLCLTGLILTILCSICHFSTDSNHNEERKAYFKFSDNSKEFLNPTQFSDNSFYFHVKKLTENRYTEIGPGAAQRCY